MLHPTYTIRSIRRRPLEGVTGPSQCTLEGVMKFDGGESPHCVYNEAVGVRLAQTLHAPIADGVLTASGDGPAFVSLYLAAVPDRLPNLHWNRRLEVAGKYPGEVAALVAFDGVLVTFQRRDGEHLSRDGDPLFNAMPPSV